jgi:predicted transcriptional regulator
MKATLDLPDELYHKVESLAAQRGETMAQFVADALTAAVVEEHAVMPGYVRTGAKDPYEGLSKEERARKWDEDEAAFMKLMGGPDHDPRSAVELIREGRR